MDWKDHIIAETDCKHQASGYSTFASESFLVTLANKGLYKRALKDLDAVERIEIKPDGDNLRVAWEEVEVTLRPNVSESACNCPSKTICKHVLMAIMVAGAYATNSTQPAVDEVETTDEVDTLNAPSPWLELKEVDISSLRKQAGKKIFEESLRLVQDGWSADFVEGDMLEATLNTENITVYFPRKECIKHAVCKCGDKGLCKHKLIAILSYLSASGGLSKEENDTPFTLLSAEALGLLRNADEFIVRLLDKGLISAGETDIESAIQYSIRMESCGIGNLARMFRSLSSDMENMLNKNVGFDQLTTFETLCRMHNTQRLILAHPEDAGLLSQLIEGTRSDYYTTPVGNFSGLGVVPWQTRSGYFGLTAYLFYHEKQTICTFTVSMADYYEKTEKLAELDNLERLYHQNAHWANGVSLSALSQSVFTLRNFKLNRQNRLSSSNQTQCNITGKATYPYYLELPAAGRLFNTELDPEEAWTYFSKKQSPQITLIPFTALKDARFSHTDQTLRFTMANEDKGEVAGELEYNQFTKTAIKRLEITGRTPGACRWMVCIKKYNAFIPISIICEEGVDNFYLS